MTTKPTTSDMTVRQILLTYGSTIYSHAIEGKGFDDKDPLIVDALAAIEAHYAAIRKADMEYVIGKNAPPSSSRVLIRNQLRGKQRQRMAERLNNTEEQV